MHEKERQKQADTKTDEARAFYNSRRWRNYRLAFLRQYPLCVDCEADGRVTLATVVDHIRPMSDGGAPWDPVNHAGRCDHHHQVKRGRERQQARRTKGAK